MLVILCNLTYIQQNLYEGLELNEEREGKGREGERERLKERREGGRGQYTAGKLVLNVTEIVSLLIKRWERRTILGVFPKGE